MGKKKVILKGGGGKHFAKDFGGDTTSDRVILPRADNCGVKVTIFEPKAGFSDFSAPDSIVYDCDETVHIVVGDVNIHQPDGTFIRLMAGDSYHVPAGVSYGLTAITDCKIFCVFSRADGGPMPDDK